jgi:hypothetical protein
MGFFKANASLTSSLNTMYFLSASPCARASRRSDTPKEEAMTSEEGFQRQNGLSQSAAAKKPLQRLWMEVLREDSSKWT